MNSDNNLWNKNKSFFFQLMSKKSKYSNIEDIIKNSTTSTQTTEENSINNSIKDSITNIQTAEENSIRNTIKNSATSTQTTEENSIKDSITTSNTIDSVYSNMFKYFFEQNEKKILNLEKECSVSKEKIENLKDKNQQLETKISNLEKECSISKEKIENLKDKNQQLETKISNLEKECPISKEKIENLKDKNQQLETKISNINESLDKRHIFNCFKFILVFLMFFMITIMFIFIHINIFKELLVDIYKIIDLPDEHKGSLKPYFRLAIDIILLFSPCILFHKIPSFFKELGEIIKILIKNKNTN